MHQRQRKTKVQTFFVILALMIGFGSFSEAKEESKEKETSWRTGMGELLSALTELVPELMSSTTESDDRFKEKSPRMIQAARKLDLRKAHNKVKAPENDPALNYLSGLFHDDMERVGSAINQGRIQYAKALVSSSISYCIACHTRSNSGAEFPLLKAFEEPLKTATGDQKVSFLAATRQFDLALSDVLAQLGNANPNLVRASDFDRISKVGLMIAVRVKASPEKGLMLTEAIEQSKNAREYLKQKAVEWKRDLTAWKNEKPQKLNSDKKLIEAARALMIPGVDTEGSRGMSSEVRQLRASELVHRLLREYPNSSFVAEGFYLIGNSYDVLGDLGFWSLGEAYFKACIEKAPHSKQALQCYDRYENSVVLGYTGSSGTHLPSDVRRDLDTLKTKAQLTAPATVPSKE